MNTNDEPMPGADHGLEAPRFLRKLVFFPLTRLVIVAFLLATAFILRDVIANGILSLPMDAEALRALVLITTVSVIYLGYVRLIEGRRVRELALQKAPRELGLGVAIGAGMIVVIVALLWTLGLYHVVGLRSWSVLVTPLVATTATAYWEEIAFRGVLFRILEEGLGTWIAMTLSAALFGLLHLSGQNASLLGAITIAATAGVFLAGVYVLTRRLWLAIGAHYAVNVTQGPIFGLPVSGRERIGLMQGTLDGPELLTGGGFGIEASLITAVVGAAVAIYVVRRAYVERRFVDPLWNRRHELSNGGILAELR